MGLLLCGVISSLLYLATDIVGGVRYDGYSFTSQAVSELMAVGAPSERVVDPLFLAYGLLVIAFGAGVFRGAAGRERALRLTGLLLIAYGAIGMTGPTLFEMHPRGASGGRGDFSHIVLTVAIVVTTLATIGAGAFGLGKRFRAYSFATMLVMIGAGSVAASFGARLAAGEPTPGFGLIERVNIYALLLWIAVLSVALFRRSPRRPNSAARPNPNVKVNGFVAEGFEDVLLEFERNFAERGEIGAAVAAYWRGEKVVDLWGGHRAPGSAEPWNSDTMVVVMSTTKGLAAMALAVANARGWLDYDAPIARYWPEFGQNEKESITVRQLLAHEAGLVLLDERLDVEKLRDLDYVARVLARQTPAWPPGTRHGYHTMTLGLYMQEIIRHVDPAHRTLGQFLHEEIAAPLGIDFFVGLPRTIPDERLAVVKPLSVWRGLLALRYTPVAVTMKMIRPGSLLRRSFAGLVADPNDRGFLEVEVPAGNGVGTARAIANAYSAFAEGGIRLGITPETFAQVTAPPNPANPIDEVLGLPSYFSLGFLRPGPDVWFGSSPRAFGAPGAGGSFAFADPDAQLGYAYVMNKLDYYLADDPREKALRDAIYRAINAKVSTRGVMSSRQILLVYGTSYGQTAKIAKFMADVLMRLGDRAEVMTAADIPSAFDLGRFDAIIVGGSIIRGRHQREVSRFVRAHLTALNTTPSAFFSVSGAAASPDEKSRAEAQRFIDEFLGQAGWYPRSAASIAGAMAYTKYNPILRWILRRTSKPMGGPTDTSRDHEYTDWSQVEHFVTGFIGTVTARGVTQPSAQLNPGSRKAESAHPV